MNEFNVKRLRHVLDLLNDIEEEILPGYIEEDHNVFRLCGEEKCILSNSDLYKRTKLLEEVICSISECRNKIRVVLGIITDKEDKNEEIY